MLLMSLECPARVLSRNIMVDRQQVQVTAKAVYSPALFIQGRQLAKKSDLGSSKSGQRGVGFE